MIRYEQITFMKAMEMISHSDITNLFVETNTDLTLENVEGIQISLDQLSRFLFFEKKEYVSSRGFGL